ncbi:plasmid mobilization protein [Brucella pituitosa]|uniref:Plasmid mobilization relaxosome protein MobC n=1 Tax=Brucella pituitosa TaxID=571256 RepID=A0ABS3JZT2_9HYPH|nr:plasmid mobilization relaxosome protein MobC [Brucella pituitosa]MBO1040185.1 plasmid mobilization relaxosome protein MobC [Brucella pituitosa]
MSESRQATSIVAFRTKPDERAALHAAASASELSISAFVRRAAFKSASMTACTYEAKQPKASSIDQAKLLGELGRIGNNVNQIARACNSSSNSASFFDSAPLLDELRALRSAIVENNGG